MTAIVWFRRDLRLDDHPALAAASAEHDRLIPLYIHDPEGDGQWAPGAASRCWLHRSLEQLDAALQERGTKLIVASGGRKQVLADLVERHDVSAVYALRAVEPALRADDKAVAEQLDQAGVAFRRFVGNELTDLQQPRTNAGDPYRVFTPYWNALKAECLEGNACGAPSAIPALPEGVQGVALDDLGLWPDKPWGDKVMAHWAPGEAGACEALEAFLSEVEDYDEERDRPDHDNTSRLSPHLAFGEISPRRILQVLREADLWNQAMPWIRQLAWREFSRYQLMHEPESPNRAWNDRWQKFPWSERDEEVIEAWQRGRTGIPMVDAGMRQLWEEGWMHNRVRMLVGSYLTKHLGQHWLVGARWFWDTLVDADLANNTMGWQWVAGTGADASPYFRVFNPATQGERHDPQAEYVTRWVPERTGADKPHQPLDDEPGADGYPPPIVGLAEGREAALARYRAFKDGDGNG